MSMIKKTVNGIEYTFFNSSRSNRSGFVHETELYRNGVFFGRNKIQYYNRTWECYTYQSVMCGLVRSLLEECREEFQNEWKNAHDVKRLTKAKRAEMDEDFEVNTPESYVELTKLYSML